MGFCQSTLTLVTLADRLVELSLLRGCNMTVSVSLYALEQLFMPQTLVSRMRRPRRQEPMSFLPRPIPLWACLDEEEKNAHRLSSFREARDTSLLLLEENAACVCSRQATQSPFLPYSQQEGIIYGLSMAWNVQVQTQKCAACQRRMIGPDGWHQGIFNWNNRVLVMEDLLDHYTSSFISSETPFVAFAATISRHYQTRQSPLPFLPEKLFREVWFGYINLVGLDLKAKEMCPVCKVEPETTIWDGISLSFSRRHLRGTLEPPLTLVANAPVRDRVKYVGAQQCVTSEELRGLLRKVVEGPSLVQGLMSNVSAPETNSDEEIDEDRDASTVTVSAQTEKKRKAEEEREKKKQKELMERFNLLALINPKLRLLHAGLADMFDRWFGHAALATRIEPPPCYKHFFIQVSGLNMVRFFLTENHSLRLKNPSYR
jgi:CxC4 like cysteine cluster associated with KDZ transposases